MKILITGGAGFIGSHLTKRLLEEGYEIICLDNFSNYYNPRIKRKNIQPFLKNRNFLLIKGDIRDRDKIKRVFKKYKFDKVVHLAAQPGVGFSFKNPSLYFDVNINGTLNLLELASKYQIKGFVFGSSSSVYGVADIPFSETSELKPISPYGVSKRAGELLCSTYHHLYSLPVTILRLFTVYGPRQRPDMAIYKFTELIDRGKEITFYGSGKTKRDYTFIDDIINGITICLRKDFDFQIFNLGDSNPISLSSLVSLIEKNLKKKAKIKHLPEQPGDPPITYADIKKSGKILGWEPKVNIGQGIKKFVNWYKNERT